MRNAAEEAKTRGCQQQQPNVKPAAAFKKLFVTKAEPHFFYKSSAATEMRMFWKVYFNISYRHYGGYDLENQFFCNVEGVPFIVICSFICKPTLNICSSMNLGLHS